MSSAIDHEHIARVSASGSTAAAIACESPMFQAAVDTACQHSSAPVAQSFAAPHHATPAPQSTIGTQAAKVIVPTGANNYLGEPGPVYVRIVPHCRARLDAELAQRRQQKPVIFGQVRTALVSNSLVSKLAG
jgi:hypothetical protein